MSGGGWISLHKRIRKSFIWTNSDQYKLWSLCLMKANFKDTKVLFNGKEISVSRGQFITGRDALASEFNDGVPRVHQVVGRTLWRWLHKFEAEQMLSITSNPKYSVITITNWDEYQTNDQQLSSSRPSTVHQLSTDNNINNTNNKTTSSGNDGASKVEQNFELLWKLYPRKEGKDVARKAYKRAIKNGAKNKAIQDGIVAYRKLVASEGRDKQYIRQGGTWFNQKGWEDEYQTEMPVDTSEPQDDGVHLSADQVKEQQRLQREKVERQYRLDHPEEFEGEND